MNISVKGLDFSYRDRKVLRSVSLEVHPGEFLGIMGPNGSGKTTLLRCLTNYLKPQAGQVLVDGTPVTDRTPREVAKLFAVVPQTSSTDFPFTALDIVMMGRIPHAGSAFGGYTKRDLAKVHEAMKRTNTLQFEKRSFGALSGGERQRVIIARAIAQEPQALLLDEPTIYLDISGQIEVMDLVRRIGKEQGMTVIAVLHDVNLAARYCDRIVLLSQGSVEAAGPPVDVLTADMLQSVYGVDVAIRRDPMTNSVYVMPRSTAARPHRHGTRVHVLCGGGTGAPVMKSLSDAGYSVSAGVLNVLDSDTESAQELRVPVAMDAPFSPITEAAHQENMRLISESVAVVVAPFPVGPGNLRNLEAAKDALGAGKKVVVLRAEAGRTIDFASGKADSAIKGLITSGAIEVDGVEALLAALGRRGERDDRQAAQGP